MKKISDMNIISTYRRKPEQLLCEAVICDKHWEISKNYEGFQSTTRYKVTTRKSSDPTLECEECMEEKQNQVNI